MGISITARKRKMLLTASAAVFILFFLFISTNNTLKTKNNNIVIPDITKGMDIDGTSLNDNTRKAKSKSQKTDAQVINANEMVTGKEGIIDESKVKNVESKNLKKKIPLVAGDPLSVNANTKERAKAKSNVKANSDNADIKVNANNKNSDVGYNNKDKVVEDDDDVTNGIKADKILGSNDQKEIHDNEINSKKTSNTKNSVNRLNKQVMEAQENAENNGPSEDNGSSFNPKHEYQKILDKSPVVIFSKSYCPFSKKLKHLLKTEYHITPEPIIIELDNHENGKELQNHVGEQTGRFTVPNFIVGGKSRGGADDILALHDNNELVDLFHAWSLGSAQMKKLTPN